MKKIPLIILLLALFSSFVLAGAIISTFEAEPGFNKVTLKWSTMIESNLKGFEVERSTDSKTFQKVGFVAAAGNSTVKKDYVYEDKTVFKAAATTYYYKLKIVNNDDSFSYFNKVIQVVPQISGVRHTWGSIKAMFR